jgi:hypothetical protein
VAASSNQIVKLVFELLDPLFGLFPCGCTIVAIILVRIERQQSDEKDCDNNDECRAHIFRLDRRQARYPATVVEELVLRNPEMLVVAGLCR